jgi:hypothetical protein
MAVITPRSRPGSVVSFGFGLDVTTGPAVLGCPLDCPNSERNRYLIWVARRYGVDVADTLEGTVAAALRIISGGGGL